jgi:hypothetical protein
MLSINAGMLIRDDMIIIKFQIPLYMVSQFNGENHLDHQSKVIDNSYIPLETESFLISINFYVLHFLEKM